MHAMILAAGRGERMRPLTDTCPKPLLQVGGQPLIVWHIIRLVRAGFVDITINHAWLGEQIVTALGDGRAFGAQLHYSAESPVLETAGGIARALPFFHGQPFLVVNGDIWCDWDLADARQPAATLSDHHPAHLLLVDNPAHHPSGDFVLHADGHVSVPVAGESALTFAGIGLYHPSLFAQTDPTRPAPLAPLLRTAMAHGTVTAQHYGGHWIDVGTPQRLAELDRRLRNASSPPC